MRCCKLMAEKKLSIAFVESATGGRVTSDFSLVPGAGDFLKGGIVCYDANLKESLLKVPKNLIEEETPESMKVTEALAMSLSDYISADIHIGITGLTAPGGSETPDKPVGTMFIAGRQKNKKIFSSRTLFYGSPEEIVEQTVFKVAELLNSYLDQL